MEWACFVSLSGLQKSLVWVSLVIGLVLFVVGIRMLFHYKGFQSPVKFPWKDHDVQAPLPLLVAILGLIFLGGPFWYLHQRFPEDSVQFDQRTFTLKEVKTKLENGYRIRIDLDPAAESFEVSKDFKADCACDLVERVCGYYNPALQCQNPAPRHYIISAPTPH